MAYSHEKGSCDHCERRVDWSVDGRVNKAKYASNLTTLVCRYDTAVMSRAHSTSSASTNSKLSLDALNAESSRRRSQIASEIDEADDPLALYDRFVKWIFDEYPREHLASSGLIELLEEATRRYKDDSSYKSDLRYLKLWTLYASLADKPSVVYKFILTNRIGTVYSLLFEDYALALERDGRCGHK
jgi:checkpoint serine/threonine-protein kinase